VRERCLHHEKVVLSLSHRGYLLFSHVDDLKVRKREGERESGRKERESGRERVEGSPPDLTYQ
jgi:hypothetical protein